jgi:hypothetical protein
MMMTCLYLRALLRVPKGVYFTVLSFLAASPLVLSGYIALSRVRDRYHNQDDISVGAIIGILGALWAWEVIDFACIMTPHVVSCQLSVQHYLTYKRSGFAPGVMPDDSDLATENRRGSYNNTMPLVSTTAASAPKTPAQ